MGTVTWPTRLLVPANVKLTLQSSSRGGGQTVDGGEQAVASPGSQRWALTFGAIAIRSSAQILAWRAIEAQADGRANGILLPIYDAARGPLLSPVTDGAFLDPAAPFLPDVTAITAAADAPVNATSIALTWRGSAPIAGQHFSVGGSLYRIAGVTPTATGAGTAVVRPWLRAVIAAGTPLVFDTPVCLMRLAKDDGLDLDLTAWRFAAPSVDFVEYF